MIRDELHPSKLAIANDHATLSLQAIPQRGEDPIDVLLDPLTEHVDRAWLRRPAAEHARLTATEPCQSTGLLVGVGDADIAVFQWVRAAGCAAARDA